MSKNIFTIKGDKTYINDKEFLVKGLRCSNALINEEATQSLIDNLDVYISHGLNTVSVFIMGNRFSDFKGYNEDGSLNQVYASRLEKIIRAADDHDMIVLVGCLYWGHSKAKWQSWSQKEANGAILNTVLFLKEHDFRNVFVDVDNEGMGLKFAGFDDRELVLTAKKVDPTFMIATNWGDPPQEADLALHLSNPAKGKPYIQSEGTVGPGDPNGDFASNSYWGNYSRFVDDSRNDITDFNNYLNIGVYTEEMKIKQCEDTKRHLENGKGYMLASTWLQAIPPLGPNHHPGGTGTQEDPGIKWWLDFMKDSYL